MASTAAPRSTARCRGRLGVELAGGQRLGQVLAAADDVEVARRRGRGRLR